MELTEEQKDKLVNKLINATKEYIQFSEDLRKHGLVFIKNVQTKNRRNTAGYIVINKRFIGQKFRVIMIPIEFTHEEYEARERRRDKLRYVKPQPDRAHDKEKVTTETINNRRLILDNF